MERTCYTDQHPAIAFCACKFPLLPLCQEHADRHLTDTSNFHFPLPLSAIEVINSKEAYIKCKPWLFQLNSNYELLWEKFQALSTGEAQIESAFQTLLKSASEANSRLKTEFLSKKEAFRTEIEKAVTETRTHALVQYESANVLAQILWNDSPYQLAQRQFFTFQAEFKQENLPSAFHVSFDFLPAVVDLDMGKPTPLTFSQQPEVLKKTEIIHVLEAENASLKSQCEVHITQLTDYRTSLDAALKQQSQSEARITELNASLQASLEQYQTLLSERKVNRKRRLLLKREKETKTAHLEALLSDSNRRNSVLEARLRSWGITTDPFIEYKNPLPDYTSPESKAALLKFGPYSEEDGELFLVRKGPIISDDGVYIGQWNSRNERHGYGKLLGNNGDVYEGQWRNDWKTGKGRYIWANGHVYIGDFLQDKYQGFGSYFFPNGDKYSGAMVNDNAEGVGSYTFGEASQKSGDRYIGEFFKDKYQGLGAYFQSNGFMCVGSWLYGALNGIGLKGWTVDGSMYFGEFFNGQNSGKGCYFWPDGDVYKGGWKNGVRFGPGRLTHPGACVEGVWSDHSLIGRLQ